MEIDEIEAKLYALEKNWNSALDLSKPIRDSLPDSETWFNHLKFLASIAHEMAVLDDLRAKKKAGK
jgi:hypothetical protein